MALKHFFFDIKWDVVACIGCDRACSPISRPYHSDTITAFGQHSEPCPPHPGVECTRVPPRSPSLPAENRAVGAPGVEHRFILAGDIFGGGNFVSGAASERGARAVFSCREYSARGSLFRR